MKIRLFVAVLMVFVYSCVHVWGQSDETEKHIPQAEPVIEYYLAIENSDLGRLKAVCSKKASLPPDRVVREYFELFGKYYGDEIFPFDSRRYSYSYEGDSTRGQVKMNMADDGFILFHVVMEGDRWKLTSNATAKRSSEAKRLIPQAMPLVEFILAVRNDDLERLKAAYTAEKEPPLTDEQTLREMKYMRLDLIGRYGFFYDPTEFDFAYEGDDSKGQVIWTIPAGRSESFRVRKENDEWKLY